MTRGSAPAVILTVVLAAIVGVLLSQRPVAALLVAAALGAALAGYLLRGTAQRLALVLARGRSLAAPDDRSFPSLRDPAWQAALDQLDRARVALSGRIDELASERARVLGIIDGLPSPILLFSHQGLSYANGAARRVFRLAGTSLPAAESPTPMQVLGIRDLADAVERTRADGAEQEVEAGREGRVYFARTSRTSQGEIALVLTDLTESRRLDAVRRDFVTNASHELKTPVAGIQALADSLGLAMTTDLERATRMVGRMQHEAARLATLVRELLDLARVEELQDARPVVRMDFSAIVESQVERVRSVMDQGGLSFTSSLAEDAWVQAATEDARMVLDNLIQNAIRYNRPGGSIDVTVTRSADTVVLVVADTGIGIPETDQERIFERFYRVDTARSRAAGGTGLGLSLVRHATQRMGGTVSVMSVLGEGSTFTVALPLAPGEATA